MTELTVPRAETPAVSVIVVTLDGWNWTRRALTALVENTDPCYELIVTDNASRDGTLDGLSRCEGVTLLRNDTNVGFGPAVNEAALHARGRHVVLLNPDTLVHPGWLRPLLAILDAEPDVAAVAPRLLHPDGTVQEAGSIVWGDAEVWPYGATQPAWRPEYRFRRDVDYASAACLVVGRSDFVDAGGFDVRYAPAYYEDVDLCLAMWERGRRVVCQPASEVTHQGGVSTDRGGRAALLARNRDRFAGRWRRFLAGRPPSPVHWEPQDVIPGRDLRCAERMLVVGDFVPDGRTPRLEALLRLLVELWPQGRITYLALDPDDAERNASPLLAAGVELAWPGEDPRQWLEQRRHHYGVVLCASWAAAMPPVGPLLDSTQPRAFRALMLDERFAADLAASEFRAAVRSCALLICESEAERVLAAEVAPAARAAVLGADTAPSRWTAALVDALAPLGMSPGCAPS